MAELEPEEQTQPNVEPHEAQAESDKTQPPVSVMRYETPAELFEEMPQVAQLTMHRPLAGETALNFLARLRASTTPEEALTFAAFALKPKIAIWWCYECLRVAGDELSHEERHLMELVANWTNYPDNENRYRAMKVALYAPVRTPAVHLGLAVGWSGGPIGPNDTAQVPPHRTPRAVNTAALMCLARSGLQNRSLRLARFIQIAGDVISTP
ncbi:MAG: hypothetical protein VX874_06380 [Pseudomonadota bacterium]|nr:hypothetical protein [Pseudomonadota bacterium]